ncbi:MAG TPA: flagellar biosynthesis regulator FlaF [Dongiaceae bacterium]|jgi:flagellar protein FlaF|nr:flagellar biosynthesis regulator FlaF [Dongiaceae bacterium]
MQQASSYNRRPNVADPPRLVEAWALTEASRRLVLGARGTSEEFRDALMLNQRLWSIFQSALSEKDCQIPQEIRRNVLTLSVVLDKQILHRLADLDGSKIQPILDINRAIAEGLRDHQAIAGPVPARANLSI